MKDCPDVLKSDDLVLDVVLHSGDGVLELGVQDVMQKLEMFSGVCIVLLIYEGLLELRPAVDERSKRRSKGESNQRCGDAGVVLEDILQGLLEQRALNNDAVNFKLLAGVVALLCGGC